MTVVRAHARISYECNIETTSSERLERCARKILTLVVLLIALLAPSPIASRPSPFTTRHSDRLVGRNNLAAPVLYGCEAPGVSPGQDKGVRSVQTSARYFFCALLLFHAISRTLSARDLIAASDAVPPRLRVEIVFDGPPVSPMIKASAMKEAARIWAEYGVAVSPIEAGRRGSDGAVGLSVMFTASPGPRPESGESGTLGSIRFTDGVPEPAITMYPDAVAAIVASMRVKGDAFSSLPAFRGLMEGRVLGRALAHEIGHFLLRSRNHSPAGLMRALQPASDLVAPDLRRFRLSADEVTRLVSGVPVSLHASTLALDAATLAP
jgi:hypothetical protein